MQALTLGGFLLGHVPVFAQTTAPANNAAEPLAALKGPALVLQNSLRLEEKISDIERKQAPLFVSGQRLDARPDLDLVIEGDALLRKQGLTVKAQRIEYDQSQNTLKALGNVKITREGNTFEGPSLSLQVDSFQGQFLTPKFSLLKGGGKGEASEIEFIDPQRAIIRNASYTTCTRVQGPSWLP